MPEAAFALSGVSVRREGHEVLSDVSWTVGCGERWVVLGPNGAGKTTLVQLLATYLVPSAGSVEVLGGRIGRVPVADLRQRVAYLSPALAHEIPEQLTPRQIVDAAQAGAILPWYLDPAAIDRRRTESALSSVGLGEVGERPFSTFSSGEQLRVMLARTMVTEPAALLLDEPMASLDVAGREMLVESLSRIASGPIGAAVVVLHRVEDIPVGFTHALLLRDGRVCARGALADVLTDDALSAAYGLPLRVQRIGGRFAVVGGAN